jgi:hypothetical protein
LVSGVQAVPGEYTSQPLLGNFTQVRMEAFSDTVIAVDAL